VPVFAVIFRTNQFGMLAACLRRQRGIPLRRRITSAMRIEMRGSWGIRATIVGVALLVSAGITPANAGTLEFDFLPVNTFSGTAPAGTLTAVFTDVLANQVSLKITSSLASGENLDPGKALYLNINPSKSSDLASLTFALTANTGFSQAASVQVGEDSFKPDGDGLMDILFTYTAGTKAFTTGQSQTYLITDAAGNLSASDFDFSSTCGTGCGTGGFLAAVHVQNTPSGGSGSAFVGGTVGGGGGGRVPEPSTLFLLGAGMTVLGAISRRWPRR
jgi:PEP-CTERM motif